jgi:chemotaxis protein CheD
MAHDNERRDVYLVPGAMHASADPCAVTTILGSCVAVCLTDVERRIGGINHYALPGRPVDGETLRFGTHAVRSLIEALVALGCRPARLQAKIFGGACVVSHGGSWAHHLGAQNVSVARELLGQAGIPVVAEDVEGFRGRKVIYFTDEGTAWIRRL